MKTQLRNTVNWRKKHINQLSAFYGKAPCFKELEGLFHILSEDVSETLAELNIHLIRYISECLSINCQFHMSSEINGKSEVRSERLSDLIKHHDAAVYLSPEGSREYILSDGNLAEQGVAVIYQDYIPSPYPQYRSDTWHSHLSVVDVVANMGWEYCKSYIRGRV